MSIQKVERKFQDLVSRISVQEWIRNPDIQGRVKEIFAMIREIRMAVMDRRTKDGAAELGCVHEK